MGLLRNDGDIIIDLALTNVGRKKLAQGDFKVVKYAVADDGIDYKLWIQATGSVSQDADILRTPIMEALVDERVALRYPCVSIASDTYKYLPKLDPSSDPITLNERDQSQAGKALEWQQNTYSATRSVPEDILDGSFTLLLNNDLLGIQGETPRAISADNTAYYNIKRTDVNSVGGAKVAVSVLVKSLDSEMWDSLGEGTKPNRTINTVIYAWGNQSGLNSMVNVTINEALTR